MLTSESVQNQSPIYYLSRPIWAISHHLTLVLYSLPICPLLNPAAKNCCLPIAVLACGHLPSLRLRPAAGLLAYSTGHQQLVPATKRR